MEARLEPSPAKVFFFESNLPKYYILCMYFLLKYLANLSLIKNVETKDKIEKVIRKGTENFQSIYFIEQIIIKTI